MNHHHHHHHHHQQHNQQHHDHFDSPEWASLILLVHLWLSLEHPHLPPAGGSDEDDDDDEDEDDDEEDEDGFDHPVYEPINRSSPFSTSNKRSIKNKMGKTCIFYQIGQRNRMKELCKSKLARLEAMLV